LAKLFGDPKRKGPVMKPGLSKLIAETSFELSASRTENFKKYLFISYL